MYFAGSGLLPLPFKSLLEERLGRPAISLQDFNRAEKAAKAAKAATEQAEPSTS